MHAAPPRASFARFRHKHGFQAALFRPPQINPCNHHQDSQRRGGFYQIIARRAEHHIAVDFIHRVIPALTARHGTDDFRRIRIDGDHGRFVVVVHAEHGNHIVGARRDILHHRSGFLIDELPRRLRLCRQRLRLRLRGNVQAFALFAGDVGKQQHAQPCYGKQGQEGDDQQPEIKMPPPHGQVAAIGLLAGVGRVLCIHSIHLFIECIGSGYCASGQ